MIHATQTHGAPSGKEHEYLDGWQRARAEFDNFRKRLGQHQQAETQRARAAALHSLLTVADNFQAILKHIPAEFADHSWTEGVRHVAREFEHVLRSQGVEVINETQVPFDPAVHEAVAQTQNSEVTSGLVLEVIQPGYKLGDTILKPARVKVSS